MNQLVEMVKRHEGLRLMPYRCTAGKLTIGYGRNLEDNGISQDEAEMLLTNDLYRTHFYLSRIVPNPRDLGKNRYYALMDMLFNLGTSRFLGFKKMLTAIKGGDFGLAADEMLDSKWARQVGSRAVELAQMMRDG